MMFSFQETIMAILKQEVGKKEGLLYGLIPYLALRHIQLKYRYPVEGDGKEYAPRYISNTTLPVPTLRQGIPGQRKNNSRYV